MLTAMEAVEQAKSFAGFVAGADKDRLSVEEIELADNSGPTWLVTLGQPAELGAYAAAAAAARGLPSKVYRVFQVRADDGQVMSMKLREFK